MLVCVDTRPLLETILELHYVVGEVGAVETVSIRSGLTAGDVILMEGDDYVGHCVNVASRLCDLAAAGEALAAPAVMEHLPSWGETVSETHVSLRGVEKPVPASSIRIAGIGADGSHDPICGLPLTEDNAQEIAHDVRGSMVLFCSPAASTPGAAGRRVPWSADGPARRVATSAVAPRFSSPSVGPRPNRTRRPHPGRCTLPSSASTQPGLWATSQGWPSGSMKIPE